MSRRHINSERSRKHPSARYSSGDEEFCTEGVCVCVFRVNFLISYPLNCSHLLVYRFLKYLSTYSFHLYYVPSFEALY